MNRRTMSRILIACLIGISLYISSIMTRPVGARVQNAAGRQTIGAVPALATPQNFTGYMAPTETVRMLISFELQNAGDLQKLTEQLYDPASPIYHQWITPEEFGKRFGRSEKEFNHAVQWLKDQGMEVDRPYSNRLTIGFTGTVDAVQRAFKVQMGHYRDAEKNRAFYSNMNPATLPADLEPITIRLQGLDNAVLFHTGVSKHKLVPATQTEDVSKRGGDGGIRPKLIVGGFQFIGPSDLALLYDYQPLWTANIKGQGQKIGTIIDSDIPDSDMTTFRADGGLPALTVTRVLFNGFSNPGVTGDVDEADVDTQSISAVAPSAEVDLVLSPSLDSTSITTLESDIITQNTIKVVSESFGGCESTNFDQSEENIFGQAVTQGIAFFASAGDEGTDCDPPDPPSTKGVECPACYPGVTGVGGTEVIANFNGNGVVTSRSSEVVWNQAPGSRTNCAGSSTGGGAGGGGVSNIVPIPTFQSSSQGFSAGVPAGSTRLVPDVAAIAEPGPIGALLVLQGSLFYGGGTSQASPLLAGMMGLINQKLGSAQGSPNTAFYRLGVNQYKNSGPLAFVDITSGNNNVGSLGSCLPNGNTGYSAKAGYDSVTGWGAPDVNVIAANFTGGPATPNYTGFVDGGTCTTISGWAADKNHLTSSINVEIYDGTTLLTTVLASNTRTDVAAFLGSGSFAAFGFSIPTPTELLNGAAHTVHVKFSTSTTELTNSPFSLTCTVSTPPSYVGYIDGATCTTIGGWAADKNHLNTSINVELYDGTTLIAIIPAVNSRPDVATFLGDNGLHGFKITTPDSLKTGATHNLHVKFAASATELTSSPAAIDCAAATPSYIGYVDGASCTQIGGWAADRNRLNTSISVEIYSGSTLIVTVIAGNSRPDVAAVLGDNGLHGFKVALPAALATGTTLTVHVKYETSATDLIQSPVSLDCAAAPDSAPEAPDVVDAALSSKGAGRKTRPKGR
jgi:subtilase family serine protease